MKDEPVSFKSLARWTTSILLVSVLILVVPRLVPSIMPQSMVLPCFTIMGLALLQNTAFSIVSRSRNRNDIRYHLIASVFSNGVWYLTFKQLLSYEMTFILFVPYTTGTVTGSVWGAKLSMIIERWLGAASDDHLKKTGPSLQEQIDELKEKLEIALSGPLSAPELSA